MSGLPAEPAFRTSIATRPGLDLIAWGIRYQIDKPNHQVLANWLGFGKARAVYRGGAGCQLNVGVAAPPPLLIPLTTGPPAWVETPRDPRIEAALTEAFTEHTTGSRRQVRAIVIIRDGQIIGERYAAGVGIETPLPGYSLTKTAISALAGIAVREGRLKMDQPAIVSSWTENGDVRATITPDELLRMTSGLDAAETHSGFDPTSRMLFSETDMARYAASLPIKDPPGQHFEYQSPNTLILSRIIADQAGGTEAAALNFARRELFAPLGMATAVLQTDPTGTPAGSQGMLASARDWARLGQLLLNGGAVNGRQILPTTWVAYMTRSTLGLPYGAGVWLSQSAIDIPQSVLTRQVLPANAFYSSGDLGQRIYIIPSARLVVVRLGASSGPDFGLRADMELMKTILPMSSVTTSTRWTRALDAGQGPN